MARSEGFVGVKVRGGLFPPSFLDALHRQTTAKSKRRTAEPEIPYLEAEDYFGEGGERSLRSTLELAWVDALRLWAAASEGGRTGAARGRWPRTLFDTVLGYGLGRGGGKAWGQMGLALADDALAVHIVRRDIDLDRRQKGAYGASRRSPHAVARGAASARVQYE